MNATITLLAMMLGTPIADDPYHVVNLKCTVTSVKLYHDSIVYGMVIENLGNYDVTIDSDGVNRLMKIVKLYKDTSHTIEHKILKDFMAENNFLKYHWSLPKHNAIKITHGGKVQQELRRRFCTIPQVNKSVWPQTVHYTVKGTFFTVNPTSPNVLQDIMKIDTQGKTTALHLTAK